MKWGRLFAAGAVAAALCAVDMPATTYAGTVSEYQQQLQKLKEQKAATTQKIQSLSRQEESLQAQIQSVQQNIGTMQSSIHQTQAQIEQQNRQLAQLRSVIAKTQQQLQHQYGVLEERVRVMYEAGQTSYLNVLFSATSFSDLLDRLELLSMIAQQDKKILNDIQASKQRLDAAEQQLEQQQRAQQQAYQLLLKQQAELEQRRRSQEALLAKVRQDKAAAQQALEDENSAMSRLQALVEQYLAADGGYTGSASGWVWPVPGHYAISSGFGPRIIFGKPEFHDGIDIPAPVGTPIVAATSGKVLYAGPAEGFGDWIVIQSAGGLLEIYGHMYADTIRVQPGQVVHAGQQIAAVGNNGSMTTGSHLHFGVARGFGNYLNPLQYVHP
jgi:murein DD-endopeptidase MepM/ murein hydrolase activator NlpD